MSELRSLMEQITALRQRLMQLQAEAGKTDSTPSR
jgi:prefoldin subunit 5